MSLTVARVEWQMKRRLRNVPEAVRDQAGEGLRRAAEYLLEVANRTVPHEEGTLEGSGTTSVDRTNLRAAVSYDTKYAIRQHEATHYRHDPGRRAKWLEKAAREQTTAIGEYLAESVKRALR